MKKHYRHENDCLNCGAELQGKFCHICGQENLEMKESFGHMINHAVSDYFHFDYQFFHTLKPLLYQPGKLTTEYLAGRRMQYLHPVKMYIFISLIYFLLILKSKHEVVDVTKDKSIAATEVGNSSPVVINGGGDGRDSTFAQYALNQTKLKPIDQDGVFQRFFVRSKFAYKEKYGKSWLEHFQEDVKHNFPKLMFVLLPLFALILQITFIKNRNYYVEHLIYGIHFHCFFFLFSSIILLIQLAIPSNWREVNNWLNLVLMVYATYYLYRSLRNIYQRSRWRTITKIIGMSVTYLIVISLGMIGLVAITAAAI